jgi:hypothetical protein
MLSNRQPTRRPYQYALRAALYRESGFVLWPIPSVIGGWPLRQLPGLKLPLNSFRRGPPQLGDTPLLPLFWEGKDRSTGDDRCEAMIGLAADRSTIDA